MLAALEIRNIALIDRLSLQLEPGLNVLTGETGAGKTIIIDSINLALGGRADRELIRTGEDSAEVVALFELENGSPVYAALAEMGIECEDGQLVISRQLSASGRNLCRIGDRLASLAQLKQVTGRLVEMHGQHEHQALADPQAQLEYLDSFARGELAELKSQIAAQYHIWRDIRSQIKRLNVTGEEAQRRTELLRFQLSELEALKLKQGEDTRLQMRLDELKQFERTGDAMEAANAALDGERGSVLDRMRKAVNALERVADAGPGYEKLSNKLSEILYQLEDAAYEVRAMFEAQDFDPQLMEKIERRLSQLNSAKIKYGPTLDDVIARQQSIEEELDDIANAEKKRHELQQKLKPEQARLIELCQQLTDARAEAGKRFSDAIKRELADLGMAKTEFTVQVTPHRQASAISPGGWDTVEFLMSANVGEALRPLSRIASGGELSRTMLALKAIAAESDATGTMIFDEIDTGISGRITQAVGEKMAAIAGGRQVIAITHQAPIAALADQEYLVRKQEREGRVYTEVVPLNSEQRVMELARIMGGDDEASVNHARSMLQRAEARRAQLRENQA